MDGLDSKTKLIPSKNPLPLSATQEAQVRDIYYARVRNHCAKEIKGRSLYDDCLNSLVNYLFLFFFFLEFATCARNRTISATWKCKDERHNMNSCMVAHAKQEEFDKAREEWFRIRLEKRRQKEIQRRKTEGKAGGLLDELPIKA